MSDAHRFQKEFLHPKYALTWLVYGLAWIGQWLPRSATLALGKAMGNQFYKRNAKRRAIVDINLQLCFPELNERQRDHMARQHFQCYGMGIVDLGLLRWGSQSKLDDLIEFKGIERVQASIKAGHEIIFLSPHVAGIDMGGTFLSSSVHLATMMKRARDPLINWILMRGRRRWGGELVFRDDGIRALIRLMRKGRSVYLVPDEDFGPESSHFVPFFGVQRSTLSVVGRLAKVTNALVVPMFTELDADTGRYTIHLLPELQNFPSGDDVADTRIVSETLENCIRIAPAQYMWTFTWFKTRPDGEASPYEHVIKSS